MSAAEYAAARAAERRELVRAVSAIADQLEGFELEPVDPGTCLKLVGTDGDAVGVRLWVSPITYGAGAGRLTIAAGVPDGAEYSQGDYRGLTRPEITASPDRAPSAVARDIVRRLVPDAVTYWRAVEANVLRRTAGESRRADMAAELAAAMGPRGYVFTPHASRYPRADIRHGSDRLYGHLEPVDGSPEYATAELRGMTYAQALELAALVAQWTR